MDLDALASAAIGAQTGQLQMAVAAKLARMNSDQDANVVKLINSAQESAQRLANVAAGVGQVVDMSA
jgi:hypothetical protein